MFGILRCNYHESSDCFEYPKKIPTSIKLPKLENTCQNFPTRKKSKISNPKKSFDHPCHSKSGVPTLLGTET